MAMLTHHTQTKINQAIMMQDNLHPELQTNTYHLEGKFIFKMIPEGKIKTHFHMVSTYDSNYMSHRFLTVCIV